MGGGAKEAGPLGAGSPADDPRGPEGLDAGSKAAQALPPPVPEAKNAVDKRLYSWKEGKAQILFCRLAAPRPDATWTINKIRTHTGQAGQLGFTDIAFEAETVWIPKAEDAGYFSARAILKTIAIHLPKELDVSEAQIQAAERAKDAALVDELKAFKAAKDLILAHELKHIDEAWATLSDQTLGWNKVLGGTAESTAKLMRDAIDESGDNGPKKITESADAFDHDDLGPLSTSLRAVGVKIGEGADKKFFYVKPA